jgi:adenosylmethionine-8-amino-7-oxononanoate aminotransferase
MAAGEQDVVLVDGDGAWVSDAQGRRYLDASAGLWYCNVGHGRAALAHAAAEQIGALETYQTFDVFATPPALELAERLRSLARLGDRSAAFFTNGGSDAIDTAAKIARRYWTLAGEPRRTTIVVREGAYHGMNAYGTSLAGIPLNAAGWGPLVTDVEIVPRHDAAALERLLGERGDSVAAFIGEPVQAAGGVHPPVEGYWERVQACCRRHDVLLIADEVVTGFGRLGTWFGSHRYGIEPDMLVGAKGLSSGYQPIGAVIAGERVLDVLWGADAGPFRHGYTYSGHATACAVALANLDIVEAEGLIERVAELEPVLAFALAPLAAHPLVAEVRAAGLLCGIEIDAGARRRRPQLLAEIVAAARRRGVLVRGLLGSTLQVSPPFVIVAEEIDLLAGVLQETLDELEATVADG